MPQNIKCSTLLIGVSALLTVILFFKNNWVIKQLFDGYEGNSPIIVFWI